MPDTGRRLVFLLWAFGFGARFSGVRKEVRETGDDKPRGVR